MEDKTGDQAEKRKNRLWTIDPQMYQTRSSRKSIGSRFGPRLKSIAFLTSMGLLLLYPFFLIYMGLVYGWIGFWGSFLGSTVVIGVAITKAGYSRNFQHAGTGNFPKGIVLLFIAFGLSILFYEGLFVARIWLLPLFVTILVTVLGYKLTRR